MIFPVLLLRSFIVTCAASTPKAHIDESTWKDLSRGALTISAVDGFDSTMTRACVGAGEEDVWRLCTGSDRTALAKEPPAAERVHDSDGCLTLQERSGFAEEVRLLGKLEREVDECMVCEAEVRMPLEKAGALARCLAPGIDI